MTQHHRPSFIHQSLRRVDRDLRLTLGYGAHVRGLGRAGHLLLRPLLRIQHGLQLGRRVEARVVGVLLVEVVLLLGLQLGRQLLKDAFKDAVDGVLLCAVAVPDCNEVGVESDGEADAAQLIVCAPC